MKKLIAWLSFMCIVISLTGCIKQQTTDTEKAAPQRSIASSEVLNSQKFIQFMEKSGCKINASILNGKGILTGKLTRIDINGDTIGMYEYKNNLEMEQDAKTIRADGSMIGNTIYEWKAKPHFYKRGNIIVTYFGDNKEIINKIESLIGKQFAGYD